MKRSLSAMALTVAIALSTAACGGSSAPIDASPAQSSPAASVSEAAPAQSHYPVTVTDQAGREVVIEEQPEKLVSGYYISTSLLIALDLDDSLVGIEAKADKRPIYALSAPELMELPNVGSAKEFDLEGCAALEPDLVILPMKLKNAAETLDGLGIDVLLVNPENRQLLSDMIHLIADATNTRQQAQQLLDFTHQHQTTLSQTLENAPAPTVYLAGNSGLLSTAGNGMYQADLIRLAGGVNAAADIEDSYWVEIDYEQLLTWDPEYIILASDATYSVEEVLCDPNLTNCTAVASGNVYQLPDKAEAWDSPVPSGTLGALWLGSILHPDLISTDQCDAVIDAYYETFYNFTYSDN